MTSKSDFYDQISRDLNLTSCKSVTLNVENLNKFVNVFRYVYMIHSPAKLIYLIEHVPSSSGKLSSLKEWADKTALPFSSSVLLY